MAAIVPGESSPPLEQSMWAQMDWLAGWYGSFASWLNGRLEWIALALVATLLVLYGGALNNFVKSWVGGRHFLVRTAAFITLCAFGYGAVLHFLTPWLHAFLNSLDSRYLTPVVVILFIAVGLLAEKKSSL